MANTCYNEALFFTISKIYLGMLLQLSIQNYGLIDRLSIDFNEQLNILTGETGAGKSIVIGALRASLGDKMDVSQIREKNSPTVIEAVFELSKNGLFKNEELSEFLDEDDPTLIIHRTLTPEGRNKIKVNGRMVNLSQLRRIGDFLMDFHGPHDHQMLLAQESHLGLLDQLCGMDDLLKHYKEYYGQYQALQKKIDELSRLKGSRERELDLLNHQVIELKQVPLKNDHYEEILQQKTKIDNVQKLSESVAAILQMLDDGPAASGESIRQSFSAMNQLNRYDESTSSFAGELSQLQETHEALVSGLRDYSTSLNFDEQEALDIRRQDDVYEEILRKYGPTIDDAQKFFEEAEARYELLSNLEHNDTLLKEELSKIQGQLSKAAEDVTKERKKTAKTLKKTIEKELKELGIAHVEFEVKIQKQPFNAKGWDSVEFYISPNIGEELKPMADIVSSGEAARVMLALKKALIEVDPIPVLVFDEIDAQIGGRLGTITGEKLRDLSKYRQVILITHLPQIASFADLHLKVTKSVKGTRSVTNVSVLDDKQRVVELAQMMSGDNETKVSIKHAKDMLSGAGK